MSKDILSKIIAHKRNEVAQRKELFPVKLLEQSVYFPSKVVSLKSYLERPDRIGIIAEMKRRSPSKGEINPYFSAEELSIGYMQAGASALSVLTDEEFFGGSNRDLTIARTFNFCPILRKDFIIDEYQIVEAKSIGADVILLIAAALSPKEINSLAAFAHSLGMEVLLEVHSKEELDQSLTAEIALVGVNNRNLQDFSVDCNRSFEVGEAIPDRCTKISESGLEDPQQIVALRNAGFRGFLIGEAFMRQSRPEDECRHFIHRIEALLSGE